MMTIAIPWMFVALTTSVERSDIDPLIIRIGYAVMHQLDVEKILCISSVTSLPRKPVKT